MGLDSRRRGYLPGLDFVGELLEFAYGLLGWPLADDMGFLDNLCGPAWPSSRERGPFLLHCRLFLGRLANISDRFRTLLYRRRLFPSSRTLFKQNDIP